MKIDLDDLELDARGTPVGLCPADHCSCMPPHACAATTLALIARIRELEVALVASIDTLHYGGHDTDDARMIRDKGVVLP